jgi:hypothetical protein
MSFSYLPLGTTRPSMEDFLPFLNRIEKRMMGLNNLLGYHGRLIVVNSILLALLTSYVQKEGVFSGLEFQSIV